VTRPTTRTARAVSETMTADPVTLTADAPLPAAAVLIAEHRVHGLPVVDGDGRVIGVVAQTDIVRVRATHDLWSNWSSLTVGDVMTSPAITVDPGAGLAEAAMLMNGNRVHRLVVVDRDGRAIGIISAGDLVRAIAAELD
jgi:CBS domain-containing protein